MVRKTYNKLVRDRIPEIIEEKGGIPKYSVLSVSDFSVALKEKLVEEAKELNEAEGRDDILNELADVSELVFAIAKNNGVTMDEVEARREKKSAERGGFAEGLFLEYVDED